MTVFVIRDGELVEKHHSAPRDEPGGREHERLPAPYVSRLTPYESPVTGREISSWRERDADMRAVDAVDLRDLPRDHQFKRGRAAQMKEAGNGRDTEPFWRDPV